MADSPFPLALRREAHFGAPSHIVKSLDRHTKLFLWMIKTAIKKWNSDLPTVDRVRPPSQWKDTPPLLTLSFGGREHQIELPTKDEDWPASPWMRRFLLTVLRNGYLFPLSDRSGESNEWRSPEVARDTFQEVLPLGSYMARPYHYWKEMSSDAAMSRLAFAGLGALRLMPYTPKIGDPEGLVRPKWQHDLDLSSYEVREGFEKYGARAIFDEDQRPIAIVRENVHYHPTRPGWEHAKWAWRCSLMVGTTVVDHLVGVHWLIGNYVTTAARFALPPTHYLRLMLKPFTWRTITINAGAYESLCPERGFVHRASALTYESLSQAFGDAVGLLEFHTVPELVRRKVGDAPGLLEDDGVTPAASGDWFPWLADALALYNVVRGFVIEYIDTYATEADILGDVYLRDFWRQLNKAPKEVGFPGFSRASLIDLLAQFVWSVTGLHEAVGTVNEYVIDPTFMGTKIRPPRGDGAEREMADVQASMQYLLIMALTGLGMPRLMDVGDAAGVFDADYRGRRVFQRFHDALEKLSAAITAANVRRMAHPTRPWPCDTFNPKNLETGVSI